LKQSSGWRENKDWQQGGEGDEDNDKVINECVHNLHISILIIISKRWKFGIYLLEFFTDIIYFKRANLCNKVGIYYKNSL
jgi:hypothetical protein